MAMKKILLATRPLTPPWDEASKNFAYFLGRTIIGHSLTLLTTKKALEGLPTTVHQEKIFSSRSFDVKAKIALFRSLRRFRKRFDVTHYLFTPTRENTGIIRWFAMPTRGKTLQTIATLRDDLYSAKTLKTILFADHLVTYTDTAKQKLERLGFTNVTRIYPGIDLERYRSQKKDETVLRAYGLAPDDFLVIYPGEYTRLGATDMLTETFLEYFNMHPDSTLKFLFACRIKNKADRVKREELRKKVRDAGQEKNILFEENPATTDMSALYNTADIIAFPVENLQGKFDVPLVIIEAYACGKPVILSDLPQFREFANDDICVTIPKNSGTKLMEKVAYLRDNKAERVRLGENARRFTEENFDLQNTARQYEKIYAAL